MFEKCEQATSNPDLLSQQQQQTKTTPQTENMNSYQQHYGRPHTYQSNQNEQIQNEMRTFDQELKYFLRNNQQMNQLQQDNNNGDSDIEEADEASLNKSLDEMILKAILVLRIHLFEMEKVNELCKDFSERYIETLKIKLNSDNMFKLEDDSDEMNESTNDDREEISREETISEQFYKSLFARSTGTEETSNRHGKKQLGKAKPYDLKSRAG